MSKQTKIIIGVVAGVLVLCLAICVIGGLLLQQVGQNVAADVKPDPEKAARTASEIAEFTPLAGYEPMSGFTILGYTMVIYSSGDQNSDMLMLMQMPGATEVNEDTMQQIQQSLERQSGNRMRNMRVIENRELTIRGKPARAIVQEGERTGSSAVMRQMMVFFQGKDGIAALTYLTDAASWDQAAVDQMIESIR